CTFTLAMVTFWGTEMAEKTRLRGGAIVCGRSVEWNTRAPEPAGLTETAALPVSVPPAVSVAGRGWPPAGIRGTLKVRVRLRGVELPGSTARPSVLLRRTVPV